MLLRLLQAPQLGERPLSDTFAKDYQSGAGKEVFLTEQQPPVSTEW